MSSSQHSHEFCSISMCPLTPLAWRLPSLTWYKMWPKTDYWSSEKVSLFLYITWGGRAYSPLPVLHLVISFHDPLQILQNSTTQVLLWLETTSTPLLGLPEAHIPWYYLMYTPSLWEEWKHLLIPSKKRENRAIAYPSCCCCASCSCFSSLFFLFIVVVYILLSHAHAKHTVWPGN